MTPDGFARERLGWWSPLLIENDSAINEDDWKACVSDKMKPQGKTAYGVKFSPDSTYVTLCGAVIPKEGPARISLIAMKQVGMGTKWLADWLNERYNEASCVVIDGKNGVDVLADKISDTWRAKGSVIRSKPKDVIAAAGLLTDMLAEKTVTWYRKHETLNESALKSTKRAISGGWGFGGDCSGPIEAASLALWGAKTTKRDPGRKMRIG